MGAHALHIRQADWSTTVILMTAYPDPQVRDEAEWLGADGFLAKPFEIDDLLTLVVNTTSLPDAPS